MKNIETLSTEQQIAFRDGIDAASKAEVAAKLAASAQAADVNPAGTAIAEALALKAESADLAVLTRTAEEGSPNIPANLTITGITGPAGSDPLVLPFTEISGGFPRWELELGGGVFWEVVRDGSDGTWYVGYWMGVSSIYLAASNSDTALSPIGLTGWTVQQGAGEPVIAGEDTAGAFLGQKCIVGNAGKNKVTYEWDGDTWRITAPSNVIEDPNNPSEYLELAVDAQGAMNPTNYSLY